MEHYRNKLRVAVRGSYSTSSTSTSHVKNISQSSAEGVKPNSESTGLSEQKSDVLIKPDFSLDNKLTLLSPQSSHHMHRALRARRKSSGYKNLTFVLSPSGSEVSQPIPEETHFIAEGENQKNQKDYLEFKQQFQKEIFQKGSKFLRSNPSTTIATESPLIFHPADNRASKKLEPKAEGSIPQRNNSRPQTTLNSRNTSPRRLKQHFEEIRNRKLDILNSNLRGLKNEKVLAAAKSEVHKISMEAAEEVYKCKFENENTKAEIALLKEKVAELETQNSVLKHDKTVLHQQILELTDKYNQTLRNYEKLEYFTNMYNGLKARFPNEGIEAILRKYDQMQDYVYNSAKRIDEVEEEKTLLRQETIEARKQLKMKDYRLQNDKLEISNMEQVHRRQLENLELEISSQKNFQKEYEALTKKVFELFIECGKILEVHTNFKGYPELNANLDTPIDCLEAIRRSLKLSTTKDTQEFIKKIIISCNLLKRKFFPHALADKFEPDQIYSQCCKYIESLENEIKRLKHKKL